MTAYVISTLEFCLMAVIRGKMTGKEIAAAYAAKAGEEVSQGSLYTTLRRLAAAGLVDKKADPQNARERLFSVTRSGREAVKEKRQYYGELIKWYDNAVARGDIPKEIP